LFGHTGPEAPHGGILKEGKALNLELVASAGEVQLFPFSKDGKMLPTDNVKLTATAQAPKKQKMIIDLKPMSDHFMGKVDAKGSYRFELQVEAIVMGKKEKIAFQVEPQG
jgi:hypothetical protein